MGVVKESRLIEELHIAIKAMFDEKIITNLFSCLTDTIRTALHRMAHLKMAEIKSYSTEQSSSISFISSTYDQMENLESSTAVLIKAQDYSEQQINQIQTIVEESVIAAVTTHLTSKL